MHTYRVSFVWTGQKQISADTHPIVRADNIREAIAKAEQVLIDSHLANRAQISKGVVRAVKAEEFPTYA